MPSQVKSSLTSVDDRHECSADPQAVQQALDQVLSSSFFRHTQQCQTLLRYIIKHSQSGEDHLLRERVIGSEVFGRRPDYEPGDDPVVRLRAAELRKRLAQFYQSTSDAGAVRIEIPAGSYKAYFRRNELQVTASRDDEVVTVSDQRPIAPARGMGRGDNEAGRLILRTRTWFVVASLIALAIAVAGTFIVTSPTATQNRRFSQFWAPWTNSANPVIISVGSNAVYRLSDQATDQYARTHALQTRGAEFFVPFAPRDTIRGDQLMPAANSFVALGDVAAVSHLVANLTRQNQRFQERFPNDISFAELRNTPSILVGGFNNPMTLELTKKLRFVLRARNEIDDTQNSDRRWVLTASADSHDTEDYAIVTRLAHSGDAPVLSVAGMGQYGTLAAADFISNPAMISAMAHDLPRDWDTRNLQLVLHVSVVDFKVASTQLIAAHIW